MASLRRRRYIEFVASIHCRFPDTAPIYWECIESKTGSSKTMSIALLWKLVHVHRIFFRWFQKSILFSSFPGMYTITVVKQFQDRLQKAPYEDYSRKDFIRVLTNFQKSKQHNSIADWLLGLYSLLSPINFLRKLSSTVFYMTFQWKRAKQLMSLLESLLNMIR